MTPMGSRKRALSPKLHIVADPGGEKGKPVKQREDATSLGSQGGQTVEGAIVGPGTTWKPRSSRLFG